jgi:hypothetical protein
MSDNFDIDRYEKAGCITEFLMILGIAFILGLGIAAIACALYFQGVSL